VVIASVSADAGIAPFEVVLTAEGLCTSAPATFVWDFGDGTPPVDTQIVAHRYDAAGSYIARVTIADTPHGVADADEVAISVSPPAP
jgi:PKD repeat protein